MNMQAKEEQENRYKPRFEPAYLDVMYKIDGNKSRGRILDVSETGMAIAISQNTKAPQDKKIISLEITPGDSDAPPYNSLGSAVTERSWAGSANQGGEHGFSVTFSEALTGNKFKNAKLYGIQQKDRLIAQQAVATLDIAYLGSYRDKMIGCQMSLFILTLTVGVGLLGAYFGLTYHSALNANTALNADLAFWRTMLASLPGLLAMSCAFMVAQKSISIQRIDTYLSILKECTIKKQYPREYKGWETDIRRFKRILGSKQCDSNRCKIENKCADIKSQDKEKKKWIEMIKGVDLYHIIIFMTFFSVIGLSTQTVISNILKFKLGAEENMIAALLVGGVIGLFIIGISYIFVHLRVGKYSIKHYKIYWCNILNKCRQPV